VSQPLASDFFSSEHTDHHALFENDPLVWELLSEIKPYLQFRLQPENHGHVIGHPVIGEQVYIGEGTVIEPGVYIEGPAWIGKNCRIRHGAYLRENVITGDDCVLGNSCEFKNCLLLNGAQVPHFSYIGDSILGYQAHLGAGVICSNLRTDQKSVKVDWKGERIDTGRRKFGAIIGDRVEVGCQAVLNPGTLLGPGSMVHPGAIVTGTLAEGAVAKNPNMIRMSD